MFQCSLFWSQDPYTVHYDISKGLPSNTIYSAFQDKKGFVWFATDVGIVKYNSQKFSLFNTDDGLTDNEVFKMKEDFRGRKWLLTLNGLPTFIKNDTIYNANNSKLIDKIENSSMLVDFYQDKNNSIYLVSKDGVLTKIDANNVVSKTVNNIANTSGIIDVNGELSIVNSFGIYNIKNKIIKTKINFSKPSRVFHTKEETYFTKFNALFKVSSNSDFKKIVELPINTEIINIYKEDNSKLWICSRKGLFLFENFILKKHCFKEKTVTSLSKDIEGNYWLTTLNNGLYLIPSFAISERNIGVTTISKKDNDEIWFGGAKNDYYIKRKNVFTKQLLHQNWRKDQISKIRFFNNKTYVIGKVGIKIIEDKEKVIPININDILEHNDTIFLGTAYASKISTTNLEKKQLHKIYENRFLDRRINVIKKIDSKIFFGTNIGLYKYKSASDIEFLGDVYPELKSTINQIFYDKESKMLLVATSSKGVIVLKEDKLLFSISKKDGLNNNSITSIEKIDVDSYLIASNKGLNTIKISTNNFTIKNYNSSFVFNNNKINDLALVSDTIYLGLDNKLIYFNKDYFHQKKPKPISFVSNISANDKTLLITKNHSLSYNQNNIKISFEGISFLDEGDINYYYKLNNGKWNFTQNRSVSYKNLKANRYTFSFYAVNGFDNKSALQTLKFKINRPYWQTWWFYTLVTLFSLSLIYYLIILRLATQNKALLKERKTLLLENENMELENQMLALEQKVLRLQMNPHFIFNALNTIKGYYSEGNTKEASSYISKFSKLLRLLLENVDQYITLHLEVEMLTLYLQLTQVRYQQKFSYKISVDESIKAKEVNIPTLLLQPIIENAIIHGVAPKSAKGIIEVSFKINENQLICSVKDNGVGRKKSKEIGKVNHTSKALTITKERLKLIEKQQNSKCTLEFEDLRYNKKALGTKVTIEIPLLKIW